MTAFRWMSVVLGVSCFLAPDTALRSMALAPPRAVFRVAGLMLVVGV